MTKPLLVLHERYTADCGDIWRVAVRRGWVTERVNRYNVAARLVGHSMVRYFGNLLHLDMIRKELPIRFHDLDLTSLANLTEFTHREILLMRYGDLYQPITTRRFVKPACVKWFEAKVYEVDDILTGSPEINDFIYVQTPVTFTDEVRCFCVDGQVLTSSLYRIGGVVWDLSGVPEDEINYDARLPDTPIPSYVSAIYQKAAVPRAVVADFGRHPDGTWSLIEFNEPWASGLYYCDPERCFDCIIASQEDAPVHS